jgi:hypothetical protein
MRRPFVIALAAFVALAFLATDAGAGRRSGSKSTQDVQTIQVKEIDIKSSPNYMSSSIGKLTYGSKVEISATEGNWYRIVTPPGYIPKTAVGRSAKSVDASKGYAASGVTHDETALAGKGFNPQVEGQYKKSSASLAAAYTQVDRVGRMTVSDSALQSFVANGKLNQ